jgi:hypothetical protein
MLVLLFPVLEAGGVAEGDSVCVCCCYFPSSWLFVIRIHTPGGHHFCTEMSGSISFAISLCLLLFEFLELAQHSPVVISRGCGVSLHILDFAKQISLLCPIVTVSATTVGWPRDCILIWKTGLF